MISMKQDNVQNISGRIHEGFSLCLFLPAYWDRKIQTANVEKGKAGRKMCMEKSVMDIITEQATNERLDTLLMQDKAFVRLQKKIDSAARAYDRLVRTKEQRLAVDRMVSAYTESGAYYSAMAYKLGFLDCADFLAEIFLDTMGRLHGKKGCGKCSLHNRKKQPETY